MKSKLRNLKEHSSIKSLVTYGRDLTFRDPRQTNRTTRKQPGDTKRAQASFTPPHAAVTARNPKGSPVLESRRRKLFASSKMNNTPVP